jgi:hypothetical protein
MGEVAACNLVGTADGVQRRRPVAQRGSFPTFPGAQSPVTYFAAVIWSVAHRCEHTFCTCTVVRQNSLRPIFKRYVSSLLHSHQRLPHQRKQNWPRPGHPSHKLPHVPTTVVSHN